MLAEFFLEHILADVLSDGGVVGGVRLRLNALFKQKSDTSVVTSV